MDKAKQIFKEILEKIGKGILFGTGAAAALFVVIAITANTIGAAFTPGTSQDITAVEQAAAEADEPEAAQGGEIPQATIEEEEAAEVEDEPQIAHFDTVNVAGFRLSHLDYEILLGVGTLTYRLRNDTNEPLRAVFQSEYFNAAGEALLWEGRAGRRTSPVDSLHRPRDTFVITSPVGVITDDNRPVHGRISVVMFDELGFPQFDDIPLENTVIIDFLPDGNVVFRAPGLEFEPLESPID